MRSRRLARARRHPRVWRLVACLLPMALSCESEPPATNGAGSGQQAVAPVVHNAFGMPGPWWRETDAADGFDADLAACRRESTAARRRPGEPDPLDAAYRAFLGCMTARGWQRGMPPLASAPAGNTKPGP